MQRSIDGAEIYLVLYEDGEFSFIAGRTFDEKSYQKAAFEVKENLLMIKYRDQKSIVPIVVKEWKAGEKYYLNIPVEEVKKVKLVDRLREIFGYSNTEELREKIGEGKLVLVAYFDDGKQAFSSTEELRILIPEGSKVLEYIVIRPYPQYSGSEELSDEEVENIRSADKTNLGHTGRDKVAALALGGKFAEIKNAKSVQREVWIIDENGEKVRRLDLVFETEDGRLIIAEVKTTKDPNSTSDYLDQALTQLGDYKELIERYGLIVGGAKKGLETLRPT
ncbi:MAG: hypothetical protein FGF48_10605 [Candidatus Brockarchaeota archaeon]|nr:hypothetical protein [Candidatus Brockarchaeota archaeon]